MPANACWGVEIGAGAIKALKLENDGGGGVTATEFAVLNHPKVLSTPELDTAEATRMALAALTNQFDLSGTPLAVSVPGHQSFARFAKLPPVEPKKVPDIVKFEAVQQIPFPLEEVEWDYQTFVSPDSPDVEVGIFAVTRPRIMELLNQMGEFGQTPEIATLGPVAVYNALAFDLEFTEKTPGTIILDIGTTATDLIIAEAGRVWVRTFPLGGHQFTDALVTSFKLSYSKAERLKREAEQTKHARHVFQAMRPVFTDLVQEVQRSIGYYQSVHPGADLKRLIGLGSTFRLPGLRKYLKQQLHMDIYRIEEFKRVKAPEGRESEFNEASLNLGTAYGLALQGLELATLQANVMPVGVVRDSMWRRKRVWFGAAAGLAAAATAGFFVRPLMDQTATDATTEPASISRVVSEGSKLKSDAEAAGVLGDATGDPAASKLIDLLSGRGVFAHLVNDVGLLASDVRSLPQFEGVGGAGLLRVVSLETVYKAPVTGPGGRSQPAEEDPRGRAGGASSGLIFAQPTAPAARAARPAPQTAASFPTEVTVDGAKVDLNSKRRVNVTLTIETGAGEPEEVAMAAVEWLREHGRRAESPYFIALKEYDRDVYEATVAPAPVPTGSAESVSVSRPGPHSARGGIIFGGGAAQQGRPAVRGGGAGVVGDDPESLIKEMERVAPITPPASLSAPSRQDPAAPGGADGQAYRLSFTLVLDKPTAGASASEDDS